MAFLIIASARRSCTTLPRGSFLEAGGGVDPETLPVTAQQSAVLKSVVGLGLWKVLVTMRDFIILCVGLGNYYVSVL